MVDDLGFMLSGCASWSHSWLATRYGPESSQRYQGLVGDQAQNHETKITQVKSVEPEEWKGLPELIDSDQPDLELRRSTHVFDIPTPRLPDVQAVNYHNPHVFQDYLPY